MVESYVAPELDGLDPATQVLRGLVVGDFLRMNQRPPTPEGCLFEHDVQYGSAGGTPLTLDLYSHREGAGRPGVVFIHGGCWIGGHPYNHIRRAAALAADGWVTATISYRLAPEHPWPAALEDAKCAVRWMRANATGLGVDPGRIAVVGDSAGGHLAAMVGLTPGWQEGDGGHGEVASNVKAMVLYYPITDLEDIPALATQRAQFVPGEAPADLREASPIHHVSAAAPPSLIITGDRDSLVPVGNSRKLQAALEAAGATSRLEVFAGHDHGFEIASRHWAATHGLMTEFLARV